MINSWKSAVNKKFGLLLIIKYEGSDKNRHVKLSYRCDCGNTGITLWQHIRTGRTTSCGCLLKNKRLERNNKLQVIKDQKIVIQKLEFLDILDKKYGMLKVIAPYGKLFNKCYCICDCGNIKIKIIKELKSGHVKSCGCLLGIKSKISKEDKWYRIPYYHYTHRSKKRFGVFDISLNEFIDLVSKPCYYCGYLPNKLKDKCCNGLDRINSELGYIKSNIVVCCKICNRMKLNYTRDKFYNKIKSIYFKLNLQNLNVNSTA